MVYLFDYFFWEDELANIKSAKKSVIQSRIRRKYNMSNKSTLRTFMKKVNKAIDKKDKSVAMTEFVRFQKCIDQQVFKKLIHKNKANRHKSNIFKKIRSI